MLRHEHVDKNLGLLVVAVASWIEGDHRSLSSACSRRTECSKLGFAGGSIATDDERRRLAVKGEELGGKRVADVAGIVTPDTLLARHRMPLRLEFSVPFVFTDTTRSSGQPQPLQERSHSDVDSNSVP